MENGVSTVTLDDLIRAALNGQPYNQQRLGTQARLYARRLSKSYAGDLPDDLHEEVFSQAFVELFEVGPAALAFRTGKAVFRRAVLAAIRSVRAAYTPRAAAPARARTLRAERSRLSTSAASLTSKRIAVPSLMRPANAPSILTSLPIRALCPLRGTWRIGSRPSRFYAARPQRWPRRFG